MKRLARIPTVFALVAMVAACTDMTGPEVTPPQFDRGQCPPGWFLLDTSNNPKDVNGDLAICVMRRRLGTGEDLIMDNRVSDVPELPTPPIPF